MKILHTSDWHLGQLFYGKSREQEQARFLNWLVELVASQGIDAVIVAGDLFDTGTPPSYARSLYNDFIVRLHHEQPACQLILLAGNHDSVAVLNESKGLLNALNTRVIAGTEVDTPEIDDVVIPLTDSAGETVAVVCGIPFLRPSDLMRSKAGHSAEEKQQQLQQQIQSYYHELYDAAKSAYPQLPVVMTGHLTTLGASTSESVKEIYIGSLDALPDTAFPPADYIALGHIHRPQKVGKNDHIRYCGAPYALGFDERSKDKQVLVVELDKTGLVNIESVAVPVFQTMTSFSGNLKAIEGQIGMYLAERETQSSSDADGLTDTAEILWAEVRVESEDYLPDLQLRIEQLIQGKPIEVLRIRRQRRETGSLADHAPGVQLDELTVEEVFLRRLQQEEALSEAEQRQFLSCFKEVAGEVTP